MIAPFLLAVALSASGHTIESTHARLPCQLELGARLHRNCAWKDGDGLVHISRNAFRRAKFDKHGLVAVLIDHTYYYVRKDGRFAPTMGMDNWAEPLSNGRARSPQKGRVGYIDQHLNLIVPAKYDGAYTFDHGLAAVCVDCRAATDGEHSWYEGGLWGCVDRYGREQAHFRKLKPHEPLDEICPKVR